MSIILGETPMERPVPRPDTIQALRWGADAAFAMLAGLQLDVFTPLQGGPLTPVQLAEAIGVGPWGVVTFEKMTKPEAVSTLVLTNTPQ
jgi:hypothetical protein